MASTLAAVHSDTGDNYSNWTFSSVRNRGELSTGTWTVKLADLTASYEWSADLAAWHPSAATSGGTTVTIAAATITDTVAPANDLVEVTATINGTSQQIFVRLKVAQ